GLSNSGLNPRLPWLTAEPDIPVPPSDVSSNFIHVPGIVNSGTMVVHVLVVNCESNPVNKEAGKDQSTLAVKVLGNMFFVRGQFVSPPPYILSFNIGGPAGGSDDERNARFTQYMLFGNHFTWSI
ncbi:hypothetical protein P879_11987, partial [Paragonimus westermani]